MRVGWAWLIGLAALILFSRLRFRHIFVIALFLIWTFFSCLLPFTDWVCNFIHELLKVFLNFWLIWIYLFFGWVFLNRLLFRLEAWFSGSLSSTSCSYGSWPAGPRSGGFGSACACIYLSVVAGLASSLRCHRARLVLIKIAIPWKWLASAKLRYPRLAFAWQCLHLLLRYRPEQASPFNNLCGSWGRVLSLPCICSFWLEFIPLIPWCWLLWTFESMFLKKAWLFRAFKVVAVFRQFIKFKIKLRFPLPAPAATRLGVVEVHLVTEYVLLFLLDLLDFFLGNAVGDSFDQRGWRYLYLVWMPSW